MLDNKVEFGSPDKRSGGFFNSVLISLEPDYLVNGEYLVDKGAAPKMLNCLIVVHLQKPYTIIKEMEFEGACSKKMDANPVAVVEAFIHINNQLHQHEAAV
ncbi:hypothetical protein GLYMA_09G081460v4 [Glycine max]|nr:hypothetical protein GLYMA_09G081460v4 [Glycine max]KAH1042076.1 hypothetical protein GYH30_024409 [Glycine max]